MGPPEHLGIGFAAKKIAPQVPLWVFLVASWLLDFLSFIFLALGLEKFAVTEINFEQGVHFIVPGSVPGSHGLFMSIIWSLIFGGIAYLIYRDTRTSAVLGLVVFSHWLLDLIVHPPDLPILFEGSPNLGLGLWSSGWGLIISFILELVLLGGGIAIYAAWRKSRKVSAA